MHIGRGCGKRAGPSGVDILGRDHNRVRVLISWRDLQRRVNARAKEEKGKWGEEEGLVRMSGDETHPQG